MNFFEHQDQAHRRTRLLVFLFILATAAIVAAVVLVVGFAAWYAEPPANPGDPLLARRWLSEHAGLFALAGVGALGLIGMGSLTKTLALRAGGGVVAQSLGGIRVQPADPDPLHRRLMNVVEEMAIASGVPVPEVYVLPEEPAINAFAAGFSPSDAAVAVTRGALERLNRDELQGVVGHEFAHVLNGDMRLNMKLIGVLHGILLIGLTARMLLRSAAWGGHGRRTRRKGEGNGTLVLIMVSLALMIVGYVGVFFGRLIQAAVSRQRELLADASGVQFTRNPGGLAGALRKIGGYTEGSRLRAVRADEVRHMLFGASGSAFASLFATHPPLEERIKALDPTFDPARERPAPEDEVDQAAIAAAEEAARGAAGASGFAGASALSGAESATRAAAPPPPAGRAIPAGEEAIRESAGSAGLHHVRYAAALLAAAPAELRAAASIPADAEALLYTLLLGREPDVRARQVEMVRARAGEGPAGRALALAAAVAAMGAEYRLPLLDLAFPALRNLGADGLARVHDTAEALASADERYDLFEYVLSRVLRCHLEDLARPDRAGSAGAGLSSHRRHAETVIAVMAVAGATDGDWSAAWRRGMETLGGAVRAPDPSALRFTDLDEALTDLATLRGRDKERVLAALTATIAADGRVTLEEAELLRAVGAALRTPIPPLHAGAAIPA